MDLQFVLDVYASVMDFVSCISKAQKGITKILQAACDEARKGNAIINPSHLIMSLTTLHTVLYTFVKVLKIIFVSNTSLVIITLILRPWCLIHR